ncbi:MAG: hypothetical protein ACC661_10750 [Verrucomicrobiales bacterium]
MKDEQETGTKGKRTPVGVLLALILGGISTVVVLNPGAGILDLIPDNLPVVGNLDEAAATAILLSCLAYLGFDLTRFFKRGGKTGEKATRQVEGEVVEEEKKG